MKYIKTLNMGVGKYDHTTPSTSVYIKSKH